MRLSGVHRKLLCEAFAPGARGWWVLAVVLGLAGGLTAIGQALLLSQLVRSALFPGGQAGPGTDLAWLLALAALRALLAGGSGAAAHRLAASVKASLRERLLNNALQPGLAAHRGVRTGELVSVMSDGVDSLEAYYAQYLPQLVYAVLLPLLIVGVVFSRDWLSGLVLLLTGPLIPLFMVLIGQASAALTRRQWKTLSRMSAFFFDILQGLPALKMLGQEARQADNIQKVSQRYRQATMAVLRVTFLSALTLELLATVSVAVVAVQIGLRLLYGRMDFLPAFFILVLAPEYYLPLRLLAQRFHAGAAGAAAAEQIYRLLDAPAGPLAPAPEVALAGTPPPKPPEICLENVSFAYPGGPPVLQDISCCLPAGRLSILMGPSGGGKSTLASVLLGLVSLQDGGVGSLIVDGRPAGRLPCAAGWAPQQPHLFQGSVIENIRLGCPDASDEAVVGAARMANAHDFITALPQGYDTLLGEQGLRLSGGQARRVALARAMLSPAPFLVFDEPTAHLDAESAQAVWASLALLAKDRTVLVITHHPAALPAESGSLSANLLLLEDGRIARLDAPVSAAPAGGARLAAYEEPIALIAPDLPADLEVRPLAVPPARTRPTVFLLSLLGPVAGFVALAALLGFAATASGAGLMSTAAYILSRAAWPASIADLQVAIVGVRFFGLARAVFRYLERLTAHHITLDLLAHLRVRLYRAIAPLAPAKLIGAQHSGSLLNQMTSDITALEGFYVRAAAPSLAAILAGGAAAVFFSAFSPVLALAVVALLAINGMLLPSLAWAGERRASPRLVQARSGLKVNLVDLLQGLPDLWVFGRAGDFQRKALQTAADLDRHHLREGIQAALFEAANGLCAHTAAWMTLAVTLPLAAVGALNPLAVGALALAAQAAFEAVQGLPQAGWQLAVDQAAAHNILAVSGQEPVVDEEAGQPVPVPVADANQPRLVIENLGFRYPADPPGNPVLDGVSLELQPGRVCVLLGASGAGKSTLVSLLLRFWDYSSGSIRLNGQELRQTRPAAARRLFAVVPQRIHLFSATLRENLLLARPGASDVELAAALGSAGLDRLVEKLPEGVDTWLGEAGTSLSGGERQRLAFARACLQDAPFLVFDEPTAHLDQASARELLGQILPRLRPCCGVLVLAHALDVALAACLQAEDELIILETGRVRWRGTFRQLDKSSELRV